MNGDRFVKFRFPSSVTVYLGWDPDNSGFGSPPSKPALCNWTATAEDRLTRYKVDTFFFTDEGTDDLETARKDVAAYLETMRTVLLWRPLVIKNLVRGGAVIPNTHGNQGDLLTHNEAVLLADCYLESVEITDDVGVNGVGVRFTFVAVAPRAVV